MGPAAPLLPPTPIPRGPRAVAHDLTLLNVGNIDVEGFDFRPALQVTESRYKLRAAGFDGAVVHLREDGRVLVAREKPDEKR